MHLFPQTLYVGRMARGNAYVKLKINIKKEYLKRNERSFLISCKWHRFKKEILLILQFLPTNPFQ